MDEYIPSPNTVPVRILTGDSKKQLVWLIEKNDETYDYIKNTNEKRAHIFVSDKTGHTTAFVQPLMRILDCVQSNNRYGQCEAAATH